MFGFSWVATMLTLYGLAVAAFLLYVIVRGERNRRAHLRVWELRNRPQPIDLQAERLRTFPEQRQEVPTGPEFTSPAIPHLGHPVIGATPRDEEAA